MLGTRFTILKKGLARQFLVTILMLVLLPTIITSVISYTVSKDALYSKVVDELSSISVLKNQLIISFLQRIETDIKVQSEQPSTVRFLQELIKAKQQSGDLLATFIDSYTWTLLVDEQAGNLQIFGEKLDYKDIYLIDLEGNILFSIAKKMDLGKNLFTGELAETHFAASVRESLDSGLTVFSDFRNYAPSDNRVSSFFTAILLNDFGDKIGFISLEIAPERIASILHHSGEDSTIESYLFGDDLFLRSRAYDIELSNALQIQMKDVVIQRWIDDYIVAENEADSQIKNSITIVEPLFYNNVQGEKVLGVLHPINFGGVQLVIVAEESQAKAFAIVDELAILMLVMLLVSILLIMLFSFPITRRIVEPIINVTEAVTKIAGGNFNTKITIKTKHELEHLAVGINAMSSVLKENKEKEKNQRWVSEGGIKLDEILRGDQDVAQLSRSIIGFVCQYLDAKIGAFYQVRGKTIHLTGSYAFTVRKEFNNSFHIGDGIVGQAVLERETIVLSPVPNDYFSINSGLGGSAPNVLWVIPVMRDSAVLAVIEMGGFQAFSPLQKQLLNSLLLPISIAMISAQSREQAQRLLEKTQAQAEELAASEEELSDKNKTLEVQANELAINRSELEVKNASLQGQQEELQTANEELELKATELEEAGSVLEEKNAALDLAKTDIEHKAEDLALSSKYKSEFLANMSHELRTPLNSLLILAKLLSNNKSGNLDDKQIEYASTIHESGTDLLNLINDLLDLSKIEAGQMDMHLEEINCRDFCSALERKLSPIPDKKGLQFIVNVADSVPECIRSDGQKLAQVVKNLLSNAFKFTQQGSVSLTMESVAKNIKLDGPYKADDMVRINVTDTGIGIDKSKYRTVFEAFQQADGTTERKFGGTGLGLSISRELVKALGGQLELESELGAGSCFYILLPKNVTGLSKLNENANSLESDKRVDSVSDGEASTVNIKKNKMLTNSSSEKSASVLDECKQIAEQQIQTENDEDIPDDRHEIKPDDRVLLIIEDDARFAKILHVLATERGFKVLHANDGESGLYMADYYKPSGIILDIGLPGIDGRQVLTRLKNNLETRHIPVHFISAQDSSFNELKQGAIGYLVKPATMEALADTLKHIESFIDHDVKRLLLIEDNDIEATAISEIIGEGQDVDLVRVASAENALQELRGNDFDCVILDLMLPDMGGTELLELIRHEENISSIPVVVYTSKDLSSEEKYILDKYAQNIIIKDPRSQEKLLDSTALFLHRVESKMPEDKRNMIRMLHDNESILEGKKAIIVDDDMRNVFALSNILQDYGFNTVVAKNGVEALTVLEENQDSDIILMDIMMPEMDGYECMRRIRAQSQYSDLPIIALTAKAMKGDRKECIDAGANDYLTKPLDAEKLISMIRVWLYR